jgi:hypothetical protein
MRASTKAILLALGGLVAAPTWARAQSTSADAAAGDVVVLRGGKILHGHLTESGAAVGIRLANGNLALTGPWSERDGGP